MRRYALHARDGAVGRVHGFCFEEEGWGVEHLLAVAGGSLFNRLVLVDVEHVRGVDRAERVVRVDLTRDKVRDGPSTVGVPCARRTVELYGYRVQANEGEAGRVEDFVVDEEGWRIRQVVVGMRDRCFAKNKALLDPRWIGRVAPEARTVHVDLTGEQIWGACRYAGYDVRDPRGIIIGRALEALVNGDAEPGYVRVSMGFRTGFLRPRAVLIPAQMVAVDEVRRVLTLH
ncbi:MAG: hypothetical protein M3R38_05885 [Actinomycetota bacterium]|nr:hypothetical protein [Actinomycetota bacterium]